MDVDGNLWKAVWKVDQNYWGLENGIIYIGSESVVNSAITEVADSHNRQILSYLTVDTSIFYFDKRKDQSN